MQMTDISDIVDVLEEYSSIYFCFKSFGTEGT